MKRLVKAALYSTKTDIIEDPDEIIRDDNDPRWKHILQAIEKAIKEGKAYHCLLEVLKFNKRATK